MDNIVLRAFNDSLGLPVEKDYNLPELGDGPEPAQ